MSTFVLLIILSGFIIFYLWIHHNKKKIATFVPCVFLVFHYFSYRVIGIKLKSEKSPWKQEYTTYKPYGDRG